MNVVKSKTDGGKNFMTELANKVAVVTGASSGIGAAIAKSFSSHKINLVLAGRNETRLKNVETEITTQYDVNVETHVTFGQIDVLVNSAGQMLSSSVTEGNVDAWDTMIDVNIKGTLYGINAVIPEFLAQSSGHIINIASISGFEVTKQSTLYSATKAAVHTITQGLEKELAKTGVRVTSISPGMVDTPLSSDTDWGGRKKLEANDIAEAAVYALLQPAHVNVNEVTVRPV